MQHMQMQHMQMLCMETACACGCLSLVTQTCATQQRMSADKTAPNTESSLIINMMFCIYDISACRLRQVIHGGPLLLIRAIVRNDAHGAVDSWLILEVVSVAVLQNIATSDVIVIVLQLGKVQSWLALKRKEKDYTSQHQFNEKPSFVPGCPHAWLALQDHAWRMTMKHVRTACAVTKHTQHGMTHFCCSDQRLAAHCPPAI